MVNEILISYFTKRSYESAEGRLYVVCRRLSVDSSRWKALGRVMAQKTAFENLQVYQLAEQLSDLAWAAIKKWQYLEKDTIGKQLVRSSDSIGANIAGSAP